MTKDEKQIAISVINTDRKEIGNICTIKNKAEKIHYSSNVNTLTLDGKCVH